MFQAALTLLAAFLLGSIPTAYVLAKLLRRTDIRRSGSGNVGALNAYRQLGKRAGVLVLALDAGKGARGHVNRCVNKIRRRPPQR